MDGGSPGQECNKVGCRLTLNCKKPIGISGGAPHQGFQARKLGRPTVEKRPQEEAALRKFLHQDVVGR